MHCNYRKARLHKRYQHLAGPYCSDTCRDREYAKLKREKEKALADSIRDKLGLPRGRGGLSIPELEAIERRLIKLLPYGGLAMMPARIKRVKVG